MCSCETSLGLNTVRTIIDKANGTDRTAPSGIASASSPTRRRRLPGGGRSAPATPWPGAQRVVEDGRALIKEAKGLGCAKPVGLG